MNITTNIPAAFAARNLNRNQEMLSTSLNRLSSGTKIITPSDDAAGLAVSEKLLSQNARLEATVSNIQSAVSYIQTADGFMGNMSKILTRMSELTTLAKDVTKNAGDVALYQEEFVGLQQQLRDTVGGGAVTTPMGAFNGLDLFATNAAGLTVTIGAEAGQVMNIGDSDLQNGAMGVLLAQTTPPAFDNDITMAGTSQMITNAINHVATERADLGASMSRLEFAAGSLSVEGQNLESAVSRIRDVDVAEESTRLARNNILVQSATSMLAQANQMPQSVLKLLQ